MRKVVTSTGGPPSTGGPVGLQTPSPGSGCGKIGLIGGGQAAACDFGGLVRGGFSADRRQALQLRSALLRHVVGCSRCARSCRPASCPKGTLCLTHSTLFTCHDRLVGCSIQVVYETVAHTSRTRKGGAIKRRRRRRLRLTAGPPGCCSRAAPQAGPAGTGGESAASGGPLTPGPEPGRPQAHYRPRLGRARHNTTRKMTRSTRRSDPCRPWPDPHGRPRVGTRPARARRTHKPRRPAGPRHQPDSADQPGYTRPDCANGSTSAPSRTAAVCASLQTRDDYAAQRGRPHLNEPIRHSCARRPS